MKRTTGKVLYIGMGGGYTEEEKDHQRARFLSAYQIIEEAELEDEYQAWKEAQARAGRWSKPRFVECVYMHEGGRMEIVFRCGDELMRIAEQFDLPFMKKEREARINALADE